MHGLIGILDVRLLEEAILAEVFVDLALHDFLNRLSGLALGLTACDFALFFKKRGIDVIAGHADRAGSRNVHRDVANELLEVVSLGDEIAFAVNFTEHANLATEVDVGVDQALAGIATRFFSSGGDSLFAKPFSGFFKIALAFNQGFFAIHQSGAGAFTQFADHFSINLYTHDTILSKLC